MRQAIETIGALSCWPAVLAHEGTHVALSWPYFEVEAIHLLDPAPAVVGVWRPHTPLYRFLIGRFAPTIVGVLIGMAVLAGFVLGALTAPDGSFETFLVGLLGVNWGIYTWPSKDDRTFPTGQDI